MANIKQQKKRIGTAQRQRMANLRYRSTIKTLFNRLQLNVDTGDKDAAEKTHKELVQLLDRSVSRGSLHKNTASRKKARAARLVLQEAKTDATTLRKAKKKAPARKPKADAAAAKPAAKKPAAKKPAAKKDAAPAEPEAVVEETPAETPVEEAPATEAEAVETPEAAADEAPAEEAAADEAPAEDEAKD